VVEFFGEVKEGLSWPTVWTRLHQLYPPSNRYIASYIFPLYTVVNSLGPAGPALGMELFKCEGYVRRRLLEGLREGLEEDEYALLLKRINISAESSRNIYDTIAHIAASLSMIVAEGFFPPDQRINSYGSNLVQEYPIYTILHNNTTPDQFPGWQGVTNTLSEWKNASQGNLSLQGPTLEPNQTAKITSDSIWYVTKIEQCFQENFINRNKIRVPPALWQRIDEIKSLQQKILNPPPPPPPPSSLSGPPPPQQPSLSSLSSLSGPLYPYPPYAPPLSAFGRPIIPIDFEEAKTLPIGLMPRPPPRPPPKKVAQPPPPALPPLLPLLPGLLPLVAMDIDTRTGGRSRRLNRNI